jgi:hypothetical protein
MAMVRGCIDGINADSVDCQLFEVRNVTVASIRLRESGENGLGVSERPLQRGEKRVEEGGQRAPRRGQAGQDEKNVARTGR